MEMFKRRNSQGEEEGTFYVLHIIPLIFYPFLLFFFITHTHQQRFFIFPTILHFGKCFKSTPDCFLHQKKMVEAIEENE